MLTLLLKDHAVRIEGHVRATFGSAVEVAVGRYDDHPDRILRIKARAPRYLSCDVRVGRWLPACGADRRGVRVEPTDDGSGLIVRVMGADDTAVDVRALDEDPFASFPHDAAGLLLLRWLPGAGIVEPPADSADGLEIAARIDVLRGEIEHALATSDLAWADSYIEVFDPADKPIALSVALLTVTLDASERLPSRPALYARVKQTCADRGYPDLETLLRGIDDGTQPTLRVVPPQT